MATIVAQASGNFSNTATWTGGVVPGSGDTAESGNYQVTVDGSTTVDTVRATGTGYFKTAGGSQTLTLTANVENSSNHSNGAFRCEHNGGTVTLVGNATGGANTNGYGVFLNNVGSFVMTGNLTGGAGSNSYGIFINAAATVNITGNATGGSGNSSYGIWNNVAGTVSLSGDATGGAGSNAHGAWNNSSGTMTIYRAIGGGGGPGGGANLTYGVWGNGAAGQVTTVKKFQSGAYGCAPYAGAVFIEEDTSNNTAQYRKTANGATVTMTHSNAADHAAASDVRHGVTYANGDRTGSAYIPTAAQVSVGVNVDNTVGTAALTPAAVWTYSTRELTSGGGGGASAADVWSYATRALTDKAGFGLTSAYDPAKTAAQAGDPMTLATNAVDSNAIAASAVSEIQTGLSTLDAAGVRAAIGLASANLDTQLGDIPTNSELASSLAGLNDVSSGDVQSAAAAALTAYDAATGTDVTSATSGLSTLTAAQVWSYVTRELTSGGGGGGGITAADVWNYATRELTGKTGYELVSAYDAAKNAMQAGSAVTLAPGQLSGLSTLTAQQVWEYVTRTLTSGGGGGSGVTAAEVWEYATRTLTGATQSVEAGMVEGTMLVYRGDTFGVSFTGLGSMTGRSALYVTAKSDTRRGDDEAVFDVKEGVGLTRLNGMAATANWGEVVVSDAATGAMTFRLEATATAALKPGTYQYDIQMTTNSGVTTLGRGSVIVTADVKRATS